MVVYQVTGSCGQYEDHKDILVGIYSSLQIAEEAQRKYLAMVAEYKQRYTEEQRQEMDKECTQLLEDDVEKWPKRLEDYWQWQYSEVQEISTYVRIQEVELDQIMYKFE